MGAERRPELARLDYGQLRAAHADRERAVDVLKAAFAEGRLSKDEYTTRVGQAYESLTYGELAVLTADLPVGPLGALALPPGNLALPPATASPAPAAVPPDRRPTSALAVASLVVGCASFLDPVGIPPLLLPVVLGGLALTRIRHARLRGRWMAMAGVALGAAGLLTALIGLGTSHW